MWRDIFVLKKNLLNRLIDAALWSATNIFISNYILPAFGIEQRYGLLIWVGTIVTMSYFEAGYAAQELVADRAANYHVGYLLTLPLPPWLVFVKLACGITLNCMVLSAFMIPLGKLILGSALNLSSLSIGKFLLVFCMLNLFCGCLSIWIYSWAKSTTRFSEVWRRVLNPFWNFGGYQFTWYVLYQAFPRFALIDLLNPVVYAFEGLRGVVLGPDKFMPWWICCVMLTLYSAILICWALAWLKKRLDYVT